MIKLFRATDKTYSSNGDIVLETAKAHVIKEDNGEFYLDLEAPLKEKEVAKTEATAGTTVEGTSFNINVDLTKQYDIQVLKGQTEQASTPTPSSPVFVNTVTGRQDIEVLGKNLFSDYRTTQTSANGVTVSGVDEGIKINGTYDQNNARDYWFTESNSSSYTNNMILLKENTTYSITVEVVSGTSTNYPILLMSSRNYETKAFTWNYQTGFSYSNGKWQYTFTTGNEKIYLGALRMTLQTSATATFDNLILRIQVEEGNATPFEKYEKKNFEINLGKNIFDSSTMVAGEIQGGNPTIRLTSRQNLWLETGTYTFSTNMVSPFRYFISIEDVGPPPLTSYPTYIYNSNWQTGSKFTFTLSQSGYLVLGVSKNNNATLTVDEIEGFNFQLEKGSVASSFSPYKTPIELCKIGNYQDFIRKGTGVNLLDTSTFVKGRLDNGVIGYEAGTTDLQTTTSSISYTTNTIYRGAVSDFISVDANANYIFTCQTSSTNALYIDYYDNDKNWLSRISQSVNGSVSKTFTTVANASYLRISFQLASAGTTTISALQLETGSTATLYEPYDYKDKWYMYKAIGKVVLDGTENWQYISVTQGSLFRSNNAITDAMVNTTFVPMSNYYKGIAFNVSQQRQNYEFYINYNLNYVDLIDNRYTDANSYKTWLGTNNVSIYYALATPTVEQIEDADILNQLSQIELLQGTNNIMLSSPYLPFIMTLHYNYNYERENKISYIDYLVPNNIIVANTPQGDQAFRISNVENTNRKIKVKANHVFYDSQNYLIRDSYVVDKNCNDALDHLNSATDNTSPFTTISDITKIASYRCVRKSLYEAIQVILERWGGHLVRDNWNIAIKSEIGQDNGVTLRFGKNIKDISATYNWDNVCTKLLPVGKDGILLNAIDPLESVYLVSETQYDLPYTKTVSFSQDDIDEDDYRDEETGEINTTAYTQALINDLIEQGQNYLQANSTPMVNYTLSANVEKISDVGDTIQVTDEKLGIDILTNIISYEYDCILDKYVELEFGNFTPTLSGLLNTISKQTEEIVDEKTTTLQVTLGEELNEATNKIWNALGNSYVIYEGDKILIVDALPKESATNVIMLNNGGIGFSNTGINGTFNSAWTIDNVLNMEQINVINLTADLVKGGTLKLGSALNQNGQLEVYDESNTLIAELNKNGLKMYGVDGSYILMNNTVGFSGYDRNDNAIYWVSKDEFHMKKSVVEEEITLCTKLRFIPIEIYSGNNLVNDGIGLVSVAGGGS